MSHKHPDITVVIPVREGSSRIKEKVLLPFVDGKNLLEWKIDQLLKVQDPALIVVSTNSEKLMEIARARGVSIHRREDILCDGHKASFSEVITGVVRDIRTPHFAWVPVVVPLMGPGDYKAAFDAYAEQVVKGGLYDSLVAVNLMKEYLWDDEGPINYKADRNHTISQDLPNIYRVTNGLYMSSTEQALKLGYFLGPNPLRFKVGKIAGIDIDEWEDYEMTLSLHSFYKGEIRI